jgi:hypothetical protein
MPVLFVGTKTLKSSREVTLRLTFMSELEIILHAKSFIDRNTRLGLFYILSYIL